MPESQIELEGALAEHLRNAELTAAAGNRIYPLLAPDHARLPYITYQRIESVHERAMGGPIGLAHARIQVDCWAATYAGVKQLANGVRRTLDGLDADIGPVASRTRVNAAFIESQSDDVEPATGGQRRVYHVSMDFTVWHREDAA